MGEERKAVKTRRKRHGGASSKEPEAVDFRRPPRPSGPQLEAIEGAAGRLAMRLQSAVAAFFRRPFRVTALPIDVQHYAVVAEESDPNAWFVPLLSKGGNRAVIWLDAAMQSDLVERFLGAPEAAAEPEADPDLDAAALPDADLDEEPETFPIGGMSRAVLDPFLAAFLREVNVILGEGSPDDRLEIDASRRAVPPARMLRTGDVVTQLRFDVRDGRRGGIAGVFVVSRNLARMLPVDEDIHPSVPVASPASRGHLERVVRDVAVPVVVNVGEASVDLPEFLRIRPGDVLILDRRVGDPLDVNVGGRDMFRAKPGRSNGRFAVRLLRRADDLEEA